MKSTKVGYYFLIVSTIIFFSIVWLRTEYGDDYFFNTEKKSLSLIERESNYLNVLFYTHYADYFIHRGVPKGFQYELIQHLATALGKKINITFENDPNLAFSNVFSNHYDIVIFDFKKSTIIKQLITISLPHSTSYPVLIKRKDNAAISIEKNKKIYVPAHFPVSLKVDSLDHPDEWSIMNSSTLTIEELYVLLDRKKIDYIVADYISAITLQPYYPNTEISRTLGEHYQRTWTLHDTNTTLNKQINSWLHLFKKSKKYAYLQKKYYTPSKKGENIPLPTTENFNISPYDKIVKKYAKNSEIDWRLILSIMYQESKFIPGLSGMGNSFGLMQFMPSTGAKYNVSASSSDEEQIKAAIKHLQVILNLFPEIENSEDKFKVMCASYNAGAGHIKDAQRLCEKYGKNPLLWKDIAEFLILKEKKQYYQDEVVQNGYYYGNHTVKYVEQIWDRYNSYKAIVKK